MVFVGAATWPPGREQHKSSYGNGSKAKPRGASRWRFHRSARRDSGQRGALARRCERLVTRWAARARTSQQSRNSGLAASTSYVYRVRASNAGGFSGYSNTVSALTLAPPAPTVPGAPASPSPASGSTGVNTSVTLHFMTGLRRPSACRICTRKAGWDKIDVFPLGEGLSSVIIRTGQPLLLVEDVEHRALAELGAKTIGKSAALLDGCSNADPGRADWGADPARSRSRSRI